MLERLLVAGSGGQGANLLGKFIARLGLDVAPHVSFVPAYGAEVRGGTSHGTIILSTAPIASPQPINKRAFGFTRGNTLMLPCRASVSDSSTSSIRSESASQST